MVGISGRTLGGDLMKAQADLLYMPITGSLGALYVPLTGSVTVTGSLTVAGSLTTTGSTIGFFAVGSVSVYVGSLVGSWTALDLSAAFGKRQVLAILKITLATIKTGVSASLSFRPYGNLDDYEYRNCTSSNFIYLENLAVASCFSFTDGNGRVEMRSEAVDLNDTVQIAVIGWIG